MAAAAASSSKDDELFHEVHAAVEEVEARAGRSSIERFIDLLPATRVAPKKKVVWRAKRKTTKKKGNSIGEVLREQPKVAWVARMPTVARRQLHTLLARTKKWFARVLKQSVDAFYRATLLTTDQLVRRHAHLQYDSLDVRTYALRKVRDNILRSLEATKGNQKLVQEGRDAVRASHASAERRTLLQHFRFMQQQGLVFELEFSAARLGLRIQFAQYGDDGRRFVFVDGTRPDCQHFATLRPSDELVGIGGKLLPECRSLDFSKLWDLIHDAPRPLLLTFIKGENRQAAFREQADRLAMLQEDRLAYREAAVREDQNPFCPPPSIAATPQVRSLRDADRHSSRRSSSSSSSSSPQRAPPPAFPPPLSSPSSSSPSLNL